MGNVFASDGGGEDDARRPGRSAWPKHFLEGNGELRAKYEIPQATFLGEGNFGVVRRVTLRRACTLQDGTECEARQDFAMKTISKNVDGDDEISILLKCRHANVAKLHEVYEDAHHLYLVLELCEGGELLDQIVARAEQGEVHTERETRRAIRQVALAVAHFHERGIVHRDLKPENVLLARVPDADDDSASLIKIVDFGLACLRPVDDQMATLVGSPFYMAPEVITRHYSSKCDVWSMGVIMHLMLTGSFPFCDGDSTSPEIYAAIQHGELTFPPDLWQGLSAAAKDVVARCLTRDEAQRPSAAELLQHPWLAVAAAPAPSGPACAPPASAQRSGSVRPLQQAIRRLRRFQRVNHLQKRAHAIVAEQLTHDEIAALLQQFRALDVNKDGRLSAEELGKALAGSGREGQMVVRESLRELSWEGDEEIDFEQFMRATLETNTHLREERLAIAFDEFDKDGDGKLTIEELQEVMGSREHALEVMRDVDTNQDGTICRDEFAQMWNRDGSRARSRRAFEAASSSANGGDGGAVAKRSRT